MMIRVESWLLGGGWQKAVGKNASVKYNNKKIISESTGTKKGVSRRKGQGAGSRKEGRRRPLY
jgi:hypothetical protein